MGYFEIEKIMVMREPVDKTWMVRTLIKGHALSYWEHHLNRRLAAEDGDLPDNDLMELVMTDVGLKYIPKRAMCNEKYCMQQGLYLGSSVSTCKERNIVYYHHQLHLSKLNILPLRKTKMSQYSCYRKCQVCLVQ
jgi:hypothetical protein